jgi:hypothetical protein
MLSQKVYNINMSHFLLGKKDRRLTGSIPGLYMYKDHTFFFLATENLLCCPPSIYAKMFVVSMLRNVNRCYGKLRNFGTCFCISVLHNTHNIQKPVLT